eukprot:TRINITY_DN18897_c0_g1_i4.p2 TRINITY_DN18897_c0_g1~~TRINITY_DN18897_c0_g1_i4.p2  ORF type:complete len:175 (+),score=43.94 TRINITY_DN18897_c0_g1_i4:193-717(+)
MCIRDRSSVGSFSPPQLTAEEEKSSVMPKHLLCDACRAVSYQMGRYLDEFNKPGNTYTNKNGETRIKESAYLEALELTCNGDRKRPDQGLAQYGVKAVNGRNRLSGPGLESSDKPGILMGGSKWPGRLANRCGELLGEHGEEEIYGVYARGEDLFGLVCAEDCAAEIEGHQQEL